MTGPELRQVRESLRVTQDEFARLIGVHPMTVSRYERNAYPIPKTVALLAGRLKPENATPSPAVV